MRLAFVGSKIFARFGSGTATAVSNIECLTDDASLQERRMANEAYDGSHNRAQ
jgi:hypothetical protein